MLSSLKLARQFWARFGSPATYNRTTFCRSWVPICIFFGQAGPFVIPNICFSNDLGGVSFSAPETVDPVMRAIRRIPQSSDPGVVPSPPCLRFLQTSLRLVTASVTFFMCLPRPVRGLCSWAAGNGLVVMKTLAVVIDPNSVSCSTVQKPRATTLLESWYITQLYLPANLAFAQMLAGFLVVLVEN